MKTSIDLDYNAIYLNWIRQNIDQFKVNENTFRLTMPFLDRNNDQIEIYIIKKGEDSFFITDDGSTLNELQFSGFDIFNSDRRKAIFDSVIQSYGVSKLPDNQLIINSSLGDLPLKKHMLSQCMIKVSDMFYLTKTNVQSVFLEDVQKFLDENEVRYLDNIFVTGKSKLTTHYDFAVGRSKESPERLIKVVNNMDLNAARNIIFAWGDTKDMRQHDAKLYTFIYDIDKKISSDALGALEEYGIKPTLWTQRNQYVSELIA